METKIDKAEIRAWMERWQAVNEFERNERLAMSLEERFAQLARLMRTARTLGLHSSTEAENQAVRDRWLRLKRGAHGAR